MSCLYFSEELLIAEVEENAEDKNSMVATVRIGILGIIIAVFDC